MTAWTLAITSAISTLLAGAAHAIDHAAAKRAVDASVATIPGDDARFDARGSHIHAADLNGDGVDEIVYMETEQCMGAAFDCPNNLMVMTALIPGDTRARSQNPGLSEVFDAQLAAVRASGYADDASEAVPGEVARIEILGNRLQVTFDVKRDSPICKRSIDRGAAPPCPAPGRYRWTYAWAPHVLTRIAPSAR